MDTEQLKLLIQAAQEAGGEAKTLIIFWLFLDIMKMGLGWWGVMWMVVRLTRTFFEYTRSQSDTSAAWEQLCRSVQCAKPLVVNYPSRNDVEDIIKAIKNQN